MIRSMANILTMSIILTIFVSCQSVFQVGDTVPDFTMPNQYGKDVTLSKIMNKKGSNGAILAFYIKDDSPG